MFVSLAPRHRGRARLWCALLCALVISLAPGSAQMVTGKRMLGFAETFGVAAEQRAPAFAAYAIQCSAPGNILWPGDTLTATLQLTNLTNQPIDTTGKVDVIAYGTKGRAGDIWTPVAYKIADADAVPIQVKIAPKGYANIEIAPTIPARFGAYALVVDLGAQGRQFATSLIRTFQANPRRVQYPKFCLDPLPVPVLQRLGVQAIRREIGYMPTTSKDFPKWLADQDAYMKSLQAANISLLFIASASNPNGPHQPLGMVRPHLDEHGVMQNTKSDYAWLPSYDPDFQQWCRMMAATYGYPKGPVNAFMLWNEPWEGISISGWGADMPRYREIYRAMATGVDQARKEDGVEVLIGGCDSTSNAMDKLFGDGSDEFLPWFDFCSIHYQGLDPHSTMKTWVNRTGPRGRVKIWDTESWVANTDDRVAAVVAASRAAGYDRAMGVFGGNIAEDVRQDYFQQDGKRARTQTTITWAPAAAVGATQHFIGERDFKELLFRNGLPWIMVFDGLADNRGRKNPDDGTLVVVGDLGEEFGYDILPFRTARGLQEQAQREAIRQQLAALPATATPAERSKLEAALTAAIPLANCTMTLPANAAYSLFDFYGNPVPAENGKIVVPLDSRGFFLRASGKRGSFAKLVNAVRSSRIEGLEPLATVCRDMTAPIDTAPVLRLSLTNVLNRPVTGTLALTLGGLTLDYPRTLTFKANETKAIPVRVTGGPATADNTYPLTLTFDAGADGKALHSELMHCNVIAKRTITVDGRLDDWEGALPQPIKTTGSGGPTMTEQAWLPFFKYDTAVKNGLAMGYLAYDDTNFYFAAKVADDSVDPGTLRFATMDDDQFYYPDVAYQYIPDKVLMKKDTVWAASTQDARGLQKPTGNDRIIAGWENTVQSFAVDLTLPADRWQQVALYFVDDDSMSRRNSKITVTDLATGTVLDKRDVSDYRYGKYLVYQLAGHVRITVSRNSWITATLSGLFFDPATTGTAEGAGAKFIAVDTETQGTWQGKYGKDGYLIVGAGEKLPAYAKLSIPEEQATTALKWPEGVRRYSYRKRPILPAGNAPNFDNIQLAFNVLPEAKKPWYSSTPGTMPGFTTYKCTDYEYALNKVAEQYGGGTEIWRLEVPGMPHKHYYPRQPKSPFDGPVQNGQLVVTHEGNTRIVECAIPWTEIPDVKACLDAGQTIKFSYRVNNNTGGPCMELSKERSVAKRNGSFHVDWVEHWANEVEFSFAK